MPLIVIIIPERILHYYVSYCKPFGICTFRTNGVFTIFKTTLYGVVVSYSTTVIIIIMIILIIIV